MARRRLSAPDQPPLLRVVLGTYEFLASLQFAVVLIALLGVVLGLGTFVEASLGTEAVKFGVWNTWWFTLLNALLAVSIFCAAAIRYPWKRHQTGFVITHIGLLVLLAGCLMSQRGGIDAQIPLLEGERGSRAYEDSHHFRIELGSRGGGGTAIGPIEFRPGPFNWSEYGTSRGWLPWALVPRDTGVIHDADGVRLEVLDFFADSTAALAPSVKLRLGTDAFAGGPGGPMWIPVDLAWEPEPLRAAQVRHRQQAGGGTVVFWKAASRAEAAAFLAGVPDPALGYGAKGQLVLVDEGRVHRMLVDDVLGKEPFAAEHPPGADPLFVEVHDYQPQLSGVRLRVRRGRDGAAEEMVVLADLPEVTIHAPRTGVYGSLWIEREVADAAERMQGKARSRIDVVQAKDFAGAARDRTTDGYSLLYRRWQAPQASAGVLPIDGRPVPAFAMPRAQLELRVDRFLPADRLDIVTLPLPFDKDKAPSAKRRAAKVRLTVDGRADEFWLAGLPIQPIEEPPGPTERRVVESATRTATITLLPDAVDVGFDVQLDNFERRLDPGTSQASHFSSLVEFLAKQDGRPLVDKPVTITMNAPVDFSDPGSGRSYRLFQESFMGPWLPGDDLYERFTREKSDKPDRLEASVLTVNYDPGRGVKYAGSGLIVIGIFTMFYMKAYFFAPRRHDTPEPQTS